jgi:hypothetical protein
VGAVPEPIQQGGRELLIAEDLYPLPEREIGGYEGATDLVSLGDEVELELTSGPLEGDEPQLVEDQQIGPPQPAVQQRKRSLIASFGEDAHQVGCAVKRYPEAASGRFYAKRDRQVSLPVPTGPAMITSAEASRNSQVANSMIFCRETPLSASQSSCSRVHIWKAGLLQAPFSGALFARAQFHLQQFPEEVFVVPTTFSGLANESRVFGGKRRELQGFEVLGNHRFSGRRVGLGCLLGGGHAPPPLPPSSQS